MKQMMIEEAVWNEELADTLIRFSEDWEKENSCCGMGERRKTRSPEEIRALTNRLNRIEGQVRGIRAMPSAPASIATSTTPRQT